MLVKTILFVAASSLAVPALAQQDSPAAMPSPATPRLNRGPADPFAQAIAAQAVADFGRRTKDPRALVVAARMLSEVSQDQAGQAAAPFSVGGLLDEADALAGDDTAMQRQIALARAGTRGVIASAFGRGLLRQVHDVAPRTAYNFTVAATGGQLLRVGAIGEPGTAMGLRLIDVSGHVVCADDRGDYAPVCATTPSARASYRVELTNRSVKPSRTVILSN